MFWVESSWSRLIAMIRSCRWWKAATGLCRALALDAVGSRGFAWTRSVMRQKWLKALRHFCHLLIVSEPVHQKCGRMVIRHGRNYAFHKDAKRRLTMHSTAAHSERLKEHSAMELIECCATSKLPVKAGLAVALQSTHSKSLQSFERCGGSSQVGRCAGGAWPCSASLSIPTCSSGSVASRRWFRSVAPGTLGAFGICMPPNSRFERDSPVDALKLRVKSSTGQFRSVTEFQEQV